MILGMISVLLNAAAQLAIKKATQFESHTIIDYLKNPYLYLTGTLYITSIIFWFGALSKLNLTIAYPLQSLGYILVPLAAVILFNERMSVTNSVGILLILGGVYLTQIGKI